MAAAVIPLGDACAAGAKPAHDAVPSEFLSKLDDSSSSELSELEDDEDDLLAPEASVKAETSTINTETIPLEGDAKRAQEKQPDEPEKAQERQMEENPVRRDGEPPGAEIDDEDIGEIEPDHYYEGGRIPVFKPNMKQFRSFKKFVSKIDKYGMKSGIVKVIPPKEWRDALPPLDEAVKTIRVKNPITQEIAGAQGTYRQANIEKQRSYNLPQWRQLSEASDHQPPARRGERRRNQEKIPRSNPRPSAVTASPSTTQSPTGAKRGRGRPRKNHKRETAHQEVAATDEQDGRNDDRPPTPTSPDHKAGERVPSSQGLSLKSPSKGGSSAGGSSRADDISPRKSKGDKAKSVSARRKYNRGAAADVVDEEAFQDFDYRITDQAEYTPERCEELEKNYWKSLTYNSPLYGADMPGSLFDDSTTSWNVTKLENLLDILGQKVPGVNTAYLYLGMWKSTFAWHLEDVDLYSINYIHFGAPKQWYSISQEDARRFETAMKNVWPNDAKNCSQFLRHKTYLISPSLLQSQYNIRVNRLVHHEGEFVITFPYGYHSGYNLGYNCAESVNFATESWLEYGRIAKKCECADDSVWIDVNDIERRLRGEETEYEETDADEDDSDDDDAGAVDLPTPPESVEGKTKQRRRKRKRDVEGDSNSTARRVRVRIKLPSKEPCMLCPNDMPSEPLLPTDDGHRAHRICAVYTPETYIGETEGGVEQIYNVANIDKARRALKCFYCRVKRGACFQCSSKKCTRAYHATCAAAAGVLVETRDVPVFGEDGQEYTDFGIDYRCRFHRPKRPKDQDGEALEASELIGKHAMEVAAGDIIQMQYLGREIFAGVVVENRRDERTVLVNVIPNRDVLEVEHKWILALDPADSFLPRPSLNAKPLPANNTQVMTSDPVAGEHFCDPASCHTWAEFHTASPQRNKEQAQVDLCRAEQLWYYLGKTSTQFRAQFSNDPTVEVHNPKSVFINTSRPTGATRTSHLVASVSLTPSSSKIGLDSTHVRGQEQQPQRQIADAQKVHESRPSKKRSGCETNPKSSDSTAAALLGARDRPSMSSTTADRLMGVTPSTANDPVTSTPSGVAGTVGRPSVVVPEGAPARPSVATTSTESEAATLDAVRSRISVPPEEGQLLLARQEPEQVIELQPGAYWSPQYGPLQRLGTLYQPLPRPPQTRHEPTVAVDPDSANFFERYPELGRIQNQAQSEYYKSPYVTTGGFSVDYLPRGSSTNPAIHSYIMHSPHQQMTYDQFFASFQPQASMMVNPLFDPQFALSSMPGAPNSTADPYMDHPATSGQNVAEMSSTAATGFSMGHTAVLNGLTMMGGQDATDNLGNPYVNRSDNQYFED